MIAISLRKRRGEIHEKYRVCLSGGGEVFFRIPAPYGSVGLSITLTLGHYDADVPSKPPNSQSNERTRYEGPIACAVISRMNTACGDRRRDQGRRMGSQLVHHPTIQHREWS